MEMSPEVLRDLCKKHELYRTPQLNDALYCSLQGFRKIANLEPYTGLVSLFLEEMPSRRLMAYRSCPTFVACRSPFSAHLFSLQTFERRQASAGA